MKNQALFSSQNISKNNKMSFAAIFVWHFKGENVLRSAIQNNSIL